MLALPLPLRSTYKVNKKLMYQNFLLILCSKYYKILYYKILSKILEKNNKILTTIIEDIDYYNYIRVNTKIKQD